MSTEVEFKDKIRKVALANGFILKRQANGKRDLNPYVYQFAEALIFETIKELEDAYAAKVLEPFVPQ